MPSNQTARILNCDKNDLNKLILSSFSKVFHNCVGGDRIPERERQTTPHDVLLDTEIAELLEQLSTDARDSALRLCCGSVKVLT